MSASLIGHSGSNTFRLSTSAVSMSLAGPRFSSESVPRHLYGAFCVKQGVAFFPSSGSWFDLARPHPDVFERDDAVGMTIRGEPACMGLFESSRVTHFFHRRVLG